MIRPTVHLHVGKGRDLVSRAPGRAASALAVAVLALWGLAATNPGLVPEPPPQPPGVLVWRVTWEKCGHVTDSVTPAVDFDLSSVAGWTLTGQENGRAVLERTEPGYCPEDRTFRHLRLEGDLILIYLGRPRPDAVVVRRHPIDRSWLLPEDIERLEAGLLVVGDEGVTRFLEGLSD